MIAAAWLLAGITPAGPGMAFESSEMQVHLLELFSSEGCSSCPPADAYLVSLRNDANLWKRFVPISFHVDYWDGLGWPDRFATAAYTERQRRYAGLWGNGRVYTPAFVVDGREVGPRQGTSLSSSGTKVGVLSARREAEKLVVTFRPRLNGKKWTVHAALLGNRFVTPVAAGENAHVSLRHEFVALRMTTAEMRPENGELVANVPFSEVGAMAAPSYSVAVWVTRDGDPTPIQATGGDLPAMSQRR